MEMQYISLTSANKDPIRDLFTETFMHSDGKEEGEFIGNRRAISTNY